MSYESSNNFYSHNNNPNPRAQQMLSSNYYNRPPPQSSAMSQYQGYPSSTSHQTVRFFFKQKRSHENIQFPSYDPYESRSTGYYPPYASSHDQQRSVGANYYGENHAEVINNALKIGEKTSYSFASLVISIFIKRHQFTE